MQIILTVSVALIAIAFLIVVIFISIALKSLQTTLQGVSKTLGGLEKQLEGVTNETAALFHKANALAEDLQEKSERLNSVVDAVKDVGATVNQFNQTFHNIANVVDEQVETNKDKISQVIQWSNLFLELKDRWKSRKQKEPSSKQEFIKIGKEHDAGQKKTKKGGGLS